MRNPHRRGQCRGPVPGAGLHPQGKTRPDAPADEGLPCGNLRPTVLGLRLQGTGRKVPPTGPRGPQEERRLKRPGQPGASMPALQPSQVGPDNADTAPARKRPEQLPYQASRDQARSGRAPHRPTKRTAEMPRGAGETPHRTTNAAGDDVVANNVGERRTQISNIPPHLRPKGPK